MSFYSIDDNIDIIYGSDFEHNVHYFLFIDSIKFIIL